MSKLFNVKSRKTIRKNLRNRSTHSEKTIWHFLRGNSLGGYKFRRQQGMGQYVIDFYCPERKLAVEIDGDSHYNLGAAARDRKKQKFIEGLGIKVLRFTDNDVRESLDNVLEIILRESRATPNPSSGRRGNN